MSNEDEFRTVGEVAALLGVSVRTLHYWEQRGLIAPSGRTSGEYRLYSDADIARLEQILIYRATGMSLGLIREVLASGDRIEHLRRQRALLIQKQDELGQMVQALDQLLEDAMGEDKLSVEDVAKVLGEANLPAWQAEAEEHWGDTDAWAESSKQTAAMSASDWTDTKERMDDVDHQLAEAMHAGVKPGSEEANALAEAHRAAIGQFMPVSYERQVILARTYVEDPRFTAHYDAYAEGLTVWLKAIIDANARTHGVDPDTAEWD
ncbi:MerR family transcriptional regulator [Neoactinobaculum massilliense]|uniref:MerR family transcriptional regulator n=1 Tax=Neoactinobaculum massilliense TaxID=2364794 RepID=UPI000F546876|nr:MerR family transcriptional regulator [Neoactinobaculum massilliense]